jgi:hypothetical protein
MTRRPGIHVAPAGGYLGAVVGGLDLRVDLSSDVMDRLRGLLNERLALFLGAP